MVVFQPYRASLSYAAPLGLRCARSDGGLVVMKSNFYRAAQKRMFMKSNFYRASLAGLEMQRSTGLYLPDMT